MYILVCYSYKNEFEKTKKGKAVYVRKQTKENWLSTR